MNRHHRVLVSGILAFSHFAYGAKFVGSISTKGIGEVEFPKIAKIGSGQAVKNAQAAAKGHVISVSLESEGGVLVYAVEIANSTKGIREVTIDAGNGSVLSVTPHLENKFKNESDAN